MTELVVRSMTHALLAAVAFAAIACDHTPPPTEPTPLPCTYVVSASSLTFAASGGSASITVTAPGGCDWTADSDREWITVASGPRGSGSGVVTVTVAANPTTVERTGTLKVAGNVITIRIDGLGPEPCTVDLTPSSAAFSHEPASGSITVTSPAHCSWSARSNVAWLTIASGASGSGSGIVTFAIDRNGDTAPRTGVITIVNRTFVVTQSGEQATCEYAVAPVEVPACMSAPVELTTTITTLAGCAWTAESGAPWITVRTPPAASGPATVRFTVADNWDAPRQGIVMIRWPTPTAGQNVRVSQAGCRYAVSATDIAIDASGGARSFDVYQESDPLECGGPLQNGCLWTAQTGVPWITISTAIPRKGDDRVSFVVLPNDSTSARNGTITVRDKTVRVTQAGR